MDTEQNEVTSHLGHVYFSLNYVSSEARERAPVTTTSEAANIVKTGEVHLRSNPRSSSRESNASGEESSANTSSTTSDLNPLAADFTPDSKLALPPRPSSTVSKLFELRETKDRGYGLFATVPIPLGTMIICEDPMIKISSQEPQFSWGAYCRLGKSEKATYDKLHAYQPEDMDLEQISRTCIIDHLDDSMDEDVEKAVQEHVRVMQIFVTNNISLPPDGTAVYATASRINHSCVPNVHHSYSSTWKKLTVFAVRDIIPGEELLFSYVGGFGCYQVRTQRREILRRNWGFTCQCPACMDSTMILDGSRSCSDSRREEMADLTRNLNQLVLGAAATKGSPGSEIFSENYQDALAQVWRLIALLLEEGLVSIELAKAYRKASEIALAMGDYANAVEYAYNEAAVERNCLGAELQDLKRMKVGSESWMNSLRWRIAQDIGQEATNTFFKPTKKQKHRNKNKNKKTRSQKNNSTQWKAVGTGNGELAGQGDTVKVDEKLDGR